MVSRSEQMVETGHLTRPEVTTQPCTDGIMMMANFPNFTQKCALSDKQISETKVRPMEAR